MINKSPAFQFYPGDFLSDENVISMTFEERGIYITLLCSCWIQGSIPADPDKIMRLLPGYSNENGVPNQVLECFKEMEGDSKRLVHHRLEKERNKQDEWREKSSQAGKKSAEIRQNKAKLKGGSNLVEPKSNSSVFSLQSSSSSLNLNTHTIYENFEEDWNLYPRKAGNKIKARVCYHKSVGKDPDKRKQFLEKMQLYVANTDLEYLKHGETFFRNWKDLEVDTVKSRKNGNKELTPMAQAMAGRGEFVDLVIRNAEALAVDMPEKSRGEIGNLMIHHFKEDEKPAVKKILFDYQWLESPQESKIEPT